MSFRPALGAAKRGRQMTTQLLTMLVRIQLEVTQPRRRDERGDVPGWVMVTVMTAGLVMVIWIAAREQLAAMLGSALASVKG